MNPVCSRIVATSAHKRRGTRYNKLVTSDDQPVLVVRPELGFSPSRFRPVATFVILAITFVFFLFEILAGGSTNPDVLLRLGAAYAPYVRHGEYWRLVMPMFLHAGWVHIILNAYALYLLGPLLERLYGYGRFAGLYVVSGIGASIVSVWRSGSIAVGASGAILGVMGAMAVIGYLHRDVVPLHWRRLFGGRMAVLILLTLAFGPVVDLAGRLLKLDLPNIDNWAHLGGLLTGAVMALFISPSSPWGQEDFGGAERPQPSQRIVVVPIAVLALTFATGADHYRIARAVTRLLEEGQRFHAVRQDDQAVKRWQEASRRAPQDERPYQELGFYYLDQNRSAEAVEEYRQALRVDRNSEEARIGLALGYRELGDFAKSREMLDPVLKEDPPDKESQEALADLYAKFRLNPEAIRHYARAIELDSSLAVAHNNLAWLYATSDDPSYRDPTQALAHARRAVELSRRKDAGYLDTLAEALYANREYAEAVKIETQALELDPANGDFKDHMARYRKAAGA